MAYLTEFAGQNWLITPAALAVDEGPPANIYNQQWLLVLSGVVIANLEGNSNSQWLHETVSILPDLAGSSDSVLNWAIGHYSIPTPPPPSTDYNTVFSVAQWAPFASVSSIFDSSQSINAGYAVDAFRNTPFGTGTDALTQAPVNNIFYGIDVDVAVRGDDAWMYRLGYNITLLGKIAFTEPFE
jgi:hypothetical protein